MSVAGAPPDLAYPKLPFWHTVSLSYSSYFRHFTDVLRASWLWLLVAGGITCFASWQQWSWMATAMADLKPGLPPPHMPPPPGMAALLSLANILIPLACVSIAVAWHRRMILGERPGLSGSNVATKTVWRYIGMAIAIFLINFLPAVGVMFPAVAFLLPAMAGEGSSPAGLFAMIALMLVLVAVGLAVAFRLSLLLPARAVGDVSIRFKEAWLRTRGNTWRLFWGIALTALPPLLLVEIAFQLETPAPGNFAGEEFVTRMTVTSTLTLIGYLLTLPIGIGFLSHAYRHFFQGGLEPVE
jgi:hypothetical protein